MNDSRARKAYESAVDKIKKVADFFGVSTESLIQEEKTEWADSMN